MGLGWGASPGSWVRVSRSSLRDPRGKEIFCVAKKVPIGVYLKHALREEKIAKEKKCEVIAELFSDLLANMCISYL